MTGLPNRPTGRRQIQLADNQVMSFKSRRLIITCLSGRIWLTDGIGGDRMIQDGQQVEIQSSGKICIQAFGPSIVHVRQPRLPSPWRRFHGGWKTEPIPTIIRS